MTAGFTLAIRSANPAGPCWLCDVAVAAKAGAESWPYPDGPPNSMAEPSSATEPSSVRRRADKNLRLGCSFITVMIVSLQNNVEPYWLSWRVAHVALRGPVGRINFVLGMLIRRNARRDENGRKLICPTKRKLRMRVMRKLPVVPIAACARRCRKTQINSTFAPSRLCKRGASRSSRVLEAGCDGREWRRKTCDCPCVGE